MKNFFLLLTICSSFSIFGQIVTEELFQIQTSEKNAKKNYFSQAI